MPEITLRIERLDGEVLCADGLGLARSFFRGDPSSIGPSSYDANAGSGDHDHIRVGDIQLLNRTMRARSKHDWWASVLDRQLDWLAEIPFDLDLIGTSDKRWAATRGSELAFAALDGLIGPHRGAAVATKMLHLKRPRFFPVLDDLVAQMLGINPPSSLRREQHVELAHRLILHVRHEGRQNLKQLQEIRRALADEGISRSLVRILDAVLWFSHPAAGVVDARRAISVRLR